MNLRVVAVLCVTFLLNACGGSTPVKPDNNSFDALSAPDKVLRIRDFINHSRYHDAKTGAAIPYEKLDDASKAAVDAGLRSVDELMARYIETESLDDIGMMFAALAVTRSPVGVWWCCDEEYLRRMASTPGWERHYTKSGRPVSTIAYKHPNSTLAKIHAIFAQHVTVANGKFLAAMRAGDRQACAVFATTQGFAAGEYQYLRGYQAIPDDVVAACAESHPGYAKIRDNRGRATSLDRDAATSAYEQKLRNKAHAALARCDEKHIVLPDTIPPPVMERIMASYHSRFATWDGVVKRGEPIEDFVAYEYAREERRRVFTDREPVSAERTPIAMREFAAAVCN